MTQEQIKVKAKEYFPNDEFKQQIVIDAINWATRELEKENAELKQTKGKVVEHFEAYGQCRDSRRIAELEKENEKLKTDYEVLSCSVGDFDELQSKLEEEQRKNNGLSDNLTKAKEHIKKLIEAIHIWDCENLEQVEAEAEQFLNEVNNALS